MAKELIEGIVSQAMDSLLGNGESLCDLDEGELNYEHPQCQKFYVLRYFPAYFCEYDLAFTTLLKKMEHHGKLPDTLNVLSCGCGSCIDYRALIYVKKKREVDIKVNYIGVDPNDWWGRPRTPDLTYRRGCISDLESRELANVDIIVFPKSLTDIPTDSLNIFADKVGRHLENDRFYLVSSFVTSDARSPDSIGGNEELRQIVESFKRVGFQPDMDPKAYWRCRKEKGLRATKDLGYFVYPDEVKDKLVNLHQHCPGRKEDAERCSNCRVGKWPILTNKYVAYSVLKLSKQ